MTADTKIIRLSFFLGIMALLLILENIFPRRPLDQKRPQRWFNNIVLIIIGSFLVSVLMPFVPFAFSVYVESKHIGLMNQVHLPVSVSILLTIVLMDIIIYFQHVCFHEIKLLWRLHLVHHTDLNLDVTTANRFHPIEIILSTGYKLLAIFIFGFPPLAYLIFEILFNFFTQFTHSNLNLPLNIDRVLRIVFVTPDIHRTHHSVKYKETNSNFGTIFIFWDRLFGLYRVEPEAGHQKMTIGLDNFRSASRLKLHHLLITPFLKNIISRYPRWF